MWFLMFCGLVAFAGKPARSCPVETSPARAVVGIGDPFTANCKSLSDQVEGMGWESSNGGVSLTDGVTSLPLNITTVTDYGLEPNCYINFVNGNQCSYQLPVTVYKIPDSVSMSLLNQMRPLIEGKTYRLQCDILNVAPVSNLSVRWHKGNEVIYTENFKHSSVQPDDGSSELNLMAHRDDNGTRIWCEAKLDFGPIGPNLPPFQSQSHVVNVLYPPTFTEPAHKELELTAGSEIALNCTATGNPVPVYSWHFPHPTQLTSKNQNTNQPILTTSIPGTYNCTALNLQGSETKHFVVKAKRDRTTLAALVGVFGSLGVLLFIGGLCFMTPEGKFSFTKGSYLRGRPTPSGPV